jgi:hypothetical protein
MSMDRLNAFRGNLFGVPIALLPKSAASIQKKVIPARPNRLQTAISGSWRIR